MAEGSRLAEADAGATPWRDWGPYLSERAWGSVREDYSADGNAWDFFPHDHARSRVYRWNEDGMAGFCDATQNWCLSLGLWNGVDPILKERMFGLTGPQGNHGEDVKEYWWYLDSTPTHSWNTWRYHYPQREFPYARPDRRERPPRQTRPRVRAGGHRHFRREPVLGGHCRLRQGRPAGPADEHHGGEPRPGRGHHPCPAHVVVPEHLVVGILRPPEAGHATGRGGRIVGEHSRSGPLVLVGDGDPEPLFCENETNVARVFGGTNETPYPKDGIDDHVRHGADTVNPDHHGTKAALHYSLTVPAGGTARVRVRLIGAPHPAIDADPSALAAAPVDVADEFDAVLATRRAEADAFYDAVIPVDQGTEEYRVARQAFAGLLWGKQFYHYDVSRWLSGDPGQPPPPPGRGTIRNGSWRHLNNHEVILMPDPWEYPWFAAWDLAFHCVTLAHIDPRFAKDQLVLLLREWYMHPNGQLPAYEWNFSDVNPPVHGWAAIRVFEIDGRTDFEFLARIFHKLLINFTWWVNSKDREQDNLFEGGFMGLDNISPLDRSSLSPDVGFLEQADSTAWMAMYALDLLDIALRLARHDRSYQDVATKFFEHFLTIAGAANGGLMWDDQDAYFYDVLHLAGGADVPMKVKSLVGLVPLRAALTYDQAIAEDNLPDFAARAVWYLSNHPEYLSLFHTRDVDGVRHRMLALVPPDRLIRLLGNVFEHDRLLGDYGIRSISAWHREHPFSVRIGDVVASVDYEPAESTTNLFGGNSNWRGPIWMPLNVLLVEALRDYERLAPGELVVEYPTGSAPASRSAKRPTTSRGGWCRSSCPARTAGVRCTAGTTCSPPTPVGRTTSRSTSTSTATPAWAWGPNTRPAGPRWSPT